MGMRASLAAAVTVAMMAVPASALVVQSQSDVMTKKGQKFSFDLGSLSAYGGTGAVLSISSGPATTGAAEDDGFDIDGKGRGRRKEFMSVFVNGTRLGKFSCGGKGETISGYTMNGSADCVFSLDIALDDETLAALMSDGTLALKIKFGRGVGHFGDGDQLNVSLRYDDVVPAPLPATGLMLLGGLAGMGAIARRRKAKARA